MVQQWPVVGRAKELQRLRERITGAAHGSVVLAGAAGVGKTRLALECLSPAEQAGLATARVTATQAARGVPFGALAPLLPPDPREHPGGFDDLGEMLRRSAAAINERAGTRGMLVVVDDAHLLDDGSALLIHQLVQTGAATVVATVRSREPAPGPIVGLWKDGLADRIEVGVLSTDAIEELLDLVLGQPIDQAAVAQLAARCAGNVLFLRELVEGALDDGTLHREGGIWLLRGSLSPSDRLVELVENRLCGLSEDERALLERVAFGEPLGEAELGTPAGADTAKLLELLEDKAILSSRVDGLRLQIWLAHPIYGDVVRALTPAVRERAIARSLADAVEATGARRREDTLRVATWRLVGGGAHPEIMLAGATAARWRYDFGLAERLARSALQDGAGFQAALLIAQLANLQGRSAEAETKLAELAATATTDEQRAAVALTRIDNAVWGIGGVGEAHRIAQEAEASIADAEPRAEVTARRSWVLLHTDGPRAAVDAAAPVLSGTERRAFVWASQAAAYGLARLGQFTAAMDVADRGRSAHLALGTVPGWHPWVFDYFRCRTLGYYGEFEEAQRLGTTQYRQALAEQSPEAQALFSMLLAQSVGDRGYPETAARHAREATAVFRQLGRPVLVKDSLTFLALALAIGGRAAEAAEAVAALDEIEAPAPTYIAVAELETRAWTAAAAGNLRRARLLLEQAAEFAASIGDLVGASTALHSLARLGRAKQAASRLRMIVGDIEGRLACARAVHAEALACSDPDGLERAAETFDEIGADLLAAEATADAAEAWRRAGDPRRATAAQRRATALAERCERPTTPVLRMIGARARLTPGEREAALLAAGGRSNKAIAEDLCLSTRTVENRLQRVYEKLGIAGRAQLGDALSTVD